ncbi:Caspase-6 [Bulinus truncatus]|nr:Caspase-6 [Bulinus truncatus]
MDDSEYDSRFPNRQQLQELNRHHAKQGDVESQSPDYKFDNERRGVAIVIVNDKFQGEIKSKREGCDKDMEDLQSTFASYGFEVRCFLDRSAKEVLSKLNEISKEDHSMSDCLVIAISTHGEEHVDENVREDLIFVSDKPIKTRTILELFTDDKCPSLKGKPRVVFIQACRGSNLDSGSEIRYKTTKKTSYDTPDFTDCVSMRSQVRDQLDSILDASEEGSPKTNKSKTDTSLIKAVAETSSYP